MESQLTEKCTFGLVSAIITRLNFTRLSTLIHFGARMSAAVFGVTSSKVKSQSSRQRHTELNTVCQVVICS